MSTAVLPVLAVKLLVPSVKVAPTGMALTTREASVLVSPVRPLTVAPRLSAMAAPSIPVSATGARLGASGLTVTASVALGGGLGLLSGALLVAASESVKLAWLVGVTVRLASDQA